MRSLSKSSRSSTVLNLVCAVWPLFGSNRVAMRMQSMIHSPNGSSLTKPFRIKCIVPKQRVTTHTGNEVLEFTQKISKYSELINDTKKTSANNSTSSLLSKAMMKPATVAEWLDRRSKYLKSGVGALQNAATRVGVSRQSR